MMVNMYIDIGVMKMDNFYFDAMDTCDFCGELLDENDYGVIFCEGCGWKNVEFN